MRHLPRADSVGSGPVRQFTHTHTNPGPPSLLGHHARTLAPRLGPGPLRVVKPFFDNRQNLLSRPSPVAPPSLSCPVLSCPPPSPSDLAQTSLASTSAHGPKMPNSPQTPTSQKHAIAPRPFAARILPSRHDVHPPFPWQLSLSLSTESEETLLNS